MIPTLLHRRAARWIVVALTAWLALAGRLTPDAGAEEASATEDSRAAAPCVLLRNDNVLFGRCRQQGEWVIISSGDGSQIRLPRRDVACWAESIRQLYQYRVDHRRNGDIDVHLKDARWCLRYDLFDLAANELRMIYRLDPDHAEAQRLEERLRRSASRPDPKPEAAGDSPQPADEADRRGDAADDSGEPGSSANGTAAQSGDAPLDSGFNLATLQAFTHRVQPMLINRCGLCHSHTSDRRWQLIVPPDQARPSARITRENLTSLAPYLNLAAPLDSELLQQALSAHGGENAPLGPADASAIDGLKSWLQQVRPASAPAAPSEAASPASAPTPPSGDLAPVRPAWPMAGSDRGGQNAAAGGGAEPPKLRSSNQPARLPPVDNPFDPELFNRRYHAKR